MPVVRAFNLIHFRSKLPREAVLPASISGRYFMARTTAELPADGKMAAMENPAAPSHDDDIVYCTLAAFATVVFLCGAWLLGNGIWLVSLGGSWYSVITGAGLLATSIFLYAASATAFWIYLATFVFILVHTFRDSGSDGWTQAPQLIGPAIVFLAMLISMPILRRHN